MSFPTVVLPSYDLTLPITKKKIVFRPFTVKEEKILLIALQEDKKRTPAAIKQVLSLCTYNKVDVSSLPQVDIEYLFVNVRNKAMSEGVEAVSTCIHCGKDTNTTLDLGKIQVEFSEKKVEPVVQITNDVWVELKYPDLDTVFDLQDMDMNDPDTGVLVIAKCMEAVISGDKHTRVADHPIEMAVAWLETLSDEQIMKMKDFFDNAPKLVFKDKYKCMHCGEVNDIRLEGIYDFFA